MRALREWWPKAARVAIAQPAYLVYIFLFEQAF